MNDLAISLEQGGTLVKVSGKLNSEGAWRLVSLFEPDKVYVIDFEKLDSIDFAAMRMLLNSSRGDGRRFCIINAAESVMERFEDSGLSSVISICRKPKPFDVDKYVEFGASFMSKAYNSPDGDSMIKVYGDFAPQNQIFQEQAVARAALVFGINTPIVGSTYSDGSRRALEFERIEGKRSFSKIISEEPDRLEEISIRFARMCKHLHNTPCDTSMFNDKSVVYRQAVANCKELTPAEKDRILAFLDTVPASTNCLHGDMQPSNVITNGKDDMWIDLADFSYGYYMFDLGMTYFLCRLNNEEMMMNLFHFGKSTMDRVWDIFISEYFDVRTPEQIAAATKSIEPFAALHMLYLGTTVVFKPFMLDYIREVFL